MVNPINSCPEVNQLNPSLLPTLKFNLQCVEHTIKVHHNYPSLSCKQTGWLEVHLCVPQIVKMNRQQMLKRIGSHWVTLEFGSHCPDSSKQANYPDDENAEILHWDTWPEHKLFSSEKEEIYTIGQCHSRVPVKEITPYLTRCVGKWGKWTASGQDDQAAYQLYQPTHIPVPRLQQQAAAATNSSPTQQT